jgi:hypothetical protein
MRAAALVGLACCAAHETAVDSPIISNELASRPVLDLPLVESTWQTAGAARLVGGQLRLELGGALPALAIAWPPVLETGRWRLRVDHTNPGCPSGTRTFIDESGTRLAGIWLAATTTASIATAELELAAPTAITVQIEANGGVWCRGTTTIHSVRIEPD